MGFGFEYGIEVIFDAPKTVAKVQLHDCTGIPITGEQRIQAWVAGDEAWTTVYEGAHVRSAHKLITAMENVAAIRVDGALTDAIWCFTEFEVSGSKIAAGIVDY